MLCHSWLFIKGNVIIGEWGIFGVEIFLCYSWFFIKGDFFIGRVECSVGLYLMLNSKLLLTTAYVTNIIQWSCCQNSAVPILAFDCSGNLSDSCVISHPIPLSGCGFGLGSSICSEFPGVANALCWPTYSHWWNHLCSKWNDIRGNSTC